MFRMISIALSAILMFGCTNKVELSGVDKSNFDTSVRPQDNFFQFVNGTWMEKTEIPADKPAYGSFHIVRDETDKRLREIIKNASNNKNKQPGSDFQKIGDFYTSYMDSVKIEELRLKPIEGELQLIEKIESWDGIAEIFAHHIRIGVQIPFTYWINQDDKNSEEYILNLYQSGLGLPDRDYYFNKGEKFEEIRSKYVEFIENILTLTNDENAYEISKKILEMEKAIAKNHWTRVENRDDEKTYNKYKSGKLDGLAPNFNWQLFFDQAEMDKVDKVIIRQPSYFSAFSNILSNYSLQDWKNYSKVKLINNFAGKLSHDFVDVSFDFYGRTLRGMEENRPRWKRAVSTIDGSLGEILGKIYVEKYFKPEAKERMVKLVDNLILSMEDRINKVDWMDENTKAEALAKLSRFNAKIGYPDRWKDYSNLVIKPDELILNTLRSAEDDFRREIDKLGQPVDREEWPFTPQTVNAGYNPTMNEVIFPAAILQPPFFNLKADDAVNYGAIGAAIGHEITHGFDDQGRKYDGYGNMREWWTKEDSERFDERAQVVVDQYSEFVPIDTLHINGELTLGENIADIGGLTVSFNAYMLSLNGKESPVLNGFTGEQRVFLGWAQVWRSLFRDEALREQILTNPHSPGEYRVNGVMNNMPEFYEAFDVKEGDGHYLPVGERVNIW